MAPPAALGEMIGQKKSGESASLSLAVDSRAQRGGAFDI
jgi:hypothetical protein